MDILYYFEVGALVLTVGSTIVGAEVIKRDLRELERRGLYEITAIVADRDRNGETMIEEWRDVYAKAGVHFDHLNPRQLSTEELKRYLDTK